ncbi:hypothetical protein BU26DRAFT_325872 [Trematosphaeria pertusa]|uniref:Uncharacterized protein n=1 Tax=Trematosphaeria pertusa TaxID=390896 RepID=A0A6A6ICU1_9PLEO|nr:uncharacterized protein BU26DRAFT_325872 [Trematosphaeria pertusa]KAF2248027.1 hypothetical protein BU26DRAFT_325872 [Trematosphaeria pertusa]
MNSSTRLYERLGQIPQDPGDPESLEDLVVCAFGAFERYYVCWKNRGGEYRQDGYDLPPALQEWLFPADGSSRDFATLQVVFGRGDEYFASDKNGKLEYKEPEKKLPPPPPPEEIEEKPVLRRSRTVSFLRPLSDTSTKQTSPAMETPSSRRSSGASQQASRPPSLAFSARSMSDASFTSQPASRPPSLSFSRTSSESSFISQSGSRPSSTTSTLSSRPPSDPEVKPIDTSFEPVYSDSPNASPVAAPMRLTRRSRPLSMSFNSVTFPRIPEGRQLLPPEPTPPIQDTYKCTCGCHDSPKRRPTYADAGVQTSPLTPPPRTALRIDTTTTTTSHFPAYHSNESSALDVQTPQDEVYEPNPVYMGRMFDYFSKPGYQLGDGLSSGYYYYQQPMYEYQEEFEDMAS